MSVRIFRGKRCGEYIFYLNGLSDEARIKLLAPFACLPVRSGAGTLLGFTNPYGHELRFDLPEAIGEIKFRSMGIHLAVTPKTGECPCGGSWGVCEYHQ